MKISLVENFTPDFDKHATHPLQSWEWGEFRKSTGLEVLRYAISENEKIVKVFQVTIHPIPYTTYKIGYIPKSELPTKDLLTEIKKYASNNNIIFLKFEPIIEFNNTTRDILKIGKYDLIKSPNPLFTKYTFCLDLTSDENALMSKMKSKTRYNVKLAEKKGVIVTEDNSDSSFEDYLRLQKETTKRQNFYAHNEQYHRKLWHILKKANIAHILTAKYENETLVSWMVFLFNDILYYPYGGSSDKYRNLMASNLMLWKAMLWGKKHDAQKFDLWGALGKNPDISDPWYGFHKFKEGYGGNHIEFIGSYDFVINPFLYSLFNLGNKLRWKILQLKR